jgi:hypothetical protein
MMPDLGPFFWHVTAAYCVTLLLLGLVTTISLIRSRRLRRQLDELEDKSRD